MKIKKIFGLAVLSLLAVSSAHAQNNNTGEITVEGVVPGTWEITVYDINSGYDFDLTSNAAALTARVGTIHIFSNDASTATGHLLVESANAGRLINSSAGPGIAAENQRYVINLLNSNLAFSNLTVNSTSTLEPDTGADWDLIVPGTVDFEAGTGSDKALEGLFDVEITIPGTQRPQASGIYTDIITFTIMDDG